jgi:glycosyltransferase involved in cell wall biosynthesis
VTVLYFADTRFPIERANGVQTMATCHALAARGHDIRLVVRPDTAPVARDPFEFYGLPRDPRLTICPVDAGGGPRTRRLRFLLSAVRQAARPSALVLTRDLGVAALLLQVPRPQRPRVVYESHGVAPVVGAELPQLLGRPELAPSAAKLRRLDRREAQVWTRAAAYVTITRALADELRARYGARDRVFVVPDAAYGRPREGGAPSDRATLDGGERTESSPPSGLVVGYAGHLYPWKGVDVLVRALALEPRARGLIIGGHPAEGDRARLEALARELGIADRVEFAGLVRPAEVARHLGRATVLVVPNTASAISDRYTSPLKLFEYLGMRRPIVASDLPALREVLMHEQTALLVKPGDPGALARALGRLADDPALAARLADQAAALAPAFTWSARAARLEAALVAASA